MGISRLILVALSLALCIPSMAAEEYIFCFPKNFRALPARNGNKVKDPILHTLTLGSSQDNSVRVHIPSVRFDTTLKLTAGVATGLALPGESIVAEAGSSEHAIYVSASSAVTITALSSRFQSSEAFFVHSTKQIGTSYVVASYSKLADDLIGLFSIIGTVDGTQVRVAGPPQSIEFDSSLAAGFIIMLNRGDVWTYKAPFNKDLPCDPTGTLITATAPVAVISGHNCAYIPVKTEACNPLYEQLLPLPSLGKSVFVPPLEGRALSIVRVIAASEGASLSVNGKKIEEIPSQGFVDLDRKLEPVWIEADHMIQVMLLSPGFRSGDSVGDPCMITMLGSADYAREQMVTTLNDVGWDNYITVILPPDHDEDVLIDGKPLDESIIKEHDNSDHRWASIKVTPGTHTIVSKEPVGVFVHGLGVNHNAFDAYGFGGSTVLKR